MDAIFGPGRYTAIPCFCHVQACGKKRRIDNAKAQRANAATRYTEKFRLANAFAPATGAVALQQAARRLRLSLAARRLLLYLESGGEDMPDAFRSIPIIQEHLKHNNVMVWEPTTGAVKFVRVLAALFGQGSAFFNFERWSAFLEAAPRRLLWLLWTMYVDDGQLTDAQAAKGTGQELAHVFFEERGAGLKAEKRVWMCQTSSFLRIGHDFEHLHETESVPFWPREGIMAEIETMMDTFASTEECPPGSAARFRGLNGFAAQAEYGQLGRAPMQPFKQRQYSDIPP